MNLKPDLEEQEFSAKVASRHFVELTQLGSTDGRGVPGRLTMIGRCPGWGIVVGQ